MEPLPTTTAPAQSPPPSVAPDRPHGWGLVARTAFRFVFVYWALYSFAIVVTFPLNVVFTAFGPKTAANSADTPGWVSVVQVLTTPLGWVSQGLDWYTRWSCHTFLGVETAIPTEPSGSGDRQYAYCTSFGYLTLAMAVGLIWTVASELWRWRTARRPGYDRLNALFRLGLRTHLIYLLISYGAMKVWCAQFPPIRDVQLETKYGDSSPMGLLWRFMEFSQPYTTATGVIEVLCGLLLVCRRTTLLGAMLSAAAAGQVFLLNMCYDVPVKLMSGHMLLMALILVVQDWRKLVRLFVLAKPVDPNPLPALFVRWKWVHRVGIGVRTLLFLAYAGLSLHEAYTEATRTGILSTPRSSVGRWVGLEFERDGQAIPFPEQPENPPPAPYKPSQWAGEPGMPAVIRVSLQPQFVAFVFPDQTGVSYLNSAEGDDELVLMRRGEAEPIARLRVTLPEPDRLVLEGPFGRQQVKMTLRRIADPPKTYVLRSKGFNWIQEFPDNR